MKLRIDTCKSRIVKSQLSLVYVPKASVDTAKYAFSPGGVSI